MTERWTSRVARLPGVELQTNLSPDESYASAAVAVRGCDGNRMFRYLLDECGIPTGVTDGGRALSVASNVFTSGRDIEAFVAAMADISANPERFGP